MFECFHFWHDIPLDCFLEENKLSFKVVLIFQELIEALGNIRAIFLYLLFQELATFWNGFSDESFDSLLIIAFVLPYILPYINVFLDGLQFYFETLQYLSHIVFKLVGVFLDHLEVQFRLLIQFFDQIFQLWGFKTVFFLKGFHLVLKFIFQIIFQIIFQVIFYINFEVYF